MQNTLNPVVNMYRTQLEASRRFADAIFAGTEKIDRVFIGATHRIFNEQLDFVQAMATVRDPRSVASTLQSGLMTRPDDSVNYQKEIMRIFAEMQTEIGRSLQDCLEQLGTQAANTAATPIRNTQEQANDIMLNPVTSMFSVWESAFKEVAALAKKNMTAARNVAEEATSRAVQSVDTAATVAANTAQDAVSAASNAATSTSASLSGAATTADEDGDQRRGPGKRK
jgi:ElaB/YqjD/DUF883 family membrane-anchored ribosome-binding protein